MTIRVLLVDDEAMIRAGLRLVLETEPDLVVVGEAGDGVAAVAAAAALGPDVVLMDIQMPRLDGLSAAREILGGPGDAKVVMLTTFNDDAYVAEALRSGASGFLLKVAPPERLVEAVRVAFRGDAVLDPTVTRGVIAAFATASRPRAERQPGPETDDLTPREAEVLHHLAHGLSNAEIAERLVIGESTVKTHVARVLMKLGVRDRVRAVVYAYEHGWVGPGGS